MSRRVEPPRLLLSARSLKGGSRATRDRELEIGARYREPEAFAVALSKAIDAGGDGVLAHPNVSLRVAMAELARPLPLYAVVPDLPAAGLLDPAPETEAMTPNSAPRRGWFGSRPSLRRLSPAGAALEGGMATRVPRLTEAALEGLPKGMLKGVVLSASVTDFALAAGHRAFFDRMLRFARGRRLAAALETANLGTLLDRLAEWQLTPDFVVAPVNARGLGMKPSRDEALAAIGRHAIPVVASELRAGGLDPLVDGARFAHEHGAHGMAPDLAEMDDVAAEFRRLRAAIDGAGPAGS